ncbi:MAG: hypothetical protein U0S12_05480 [Fimbriimonadales bacterium]
MSDVNESLNRTNELLEQLLEQERQKTSDRQAQMQSIREKINFDMPKIEGLASDAMSRGFRDPETDARFQEMRRQAEERHQEEIAFRNRLVAILDEQTALLSEIARNLRG